MTGRRKARRREPRPRMLRVSIGMDAATRARLKDRAARHGVSRAQYVRDLINGVRPGATPGSEVALADSWWDSRKPARRVSIHRNHSTATEHAGEPADQTTIFDIDTEDTDR